MCVSFMETSSIQVYRNKKFQSFAYLYDISNYDCRDHWRVLCTFRHYLFYLNEKKVIWYNLIEQAVNEEIKLKPPPIEKGFAKLN